MNEESRVLIQNLTDARSALSENQVLMQQKIDKADDAMKSVEKAQACVSGKSGRVLRNLDHDISNINIEYERNVKGLNDESAKIKNKISELNQKLIKINELNDRMNQSDELYQKRQHNAALVAGIVSKGIVKILVFPAGIEQKCIYFGFLFLVATVIAFPIALLLTAAMPSLSESIIRTPVLLILWSLEMAGYYHFRKYLRNHEMYYREKAQHHENEIRELDDKKNHILSSMRKSHAEAILEAEDLNRNLENCRLKLQELNAEKNRKVEAINAKKIEMSNWVEITEDEFLSRAVESIADKYDTDVALIDARMRANESFLENECKVGPEYQNEETLTKLISYLRNERATNIKEALEVYLREKREEFEIQTKIDFQKKQLELQKSHMERLQKQLEIIAEKKSK